MKHKNEAHVSAKSIIVTIAKEQYSIARKYIILSGIGPDDDSMGWGRYAQVALKKAALPRA